MDLFVYGTLRSPALMAAVAGPGPLDPALARIDGYVLRPVSGNVVPVVVPDASATTSGTVWRGVTEEQKMRLDLYEGAFGYRLTQVELSGAAEIALCYMPPPDIATDDGAWSLEAWETDHLEPAILAAEEVFSLAPLPAPDDLRRMWPMIEGRAWAKFRAAETPARRRYAPVPTDFETTSARPPAGWFFRYHTVQAVHRTFDGTMSDPLNREVFEGVDAAIVLPYDPVRDRVLLVEQARMGPYMRRDPNPWMLEPIAGIIDARETSEGAALREAQEEAGLSDVRLEPAGSFYVSPGATTDYYYTFVGLCDLPQDAPYRGGLPDEGEDLRLHPMAFDDALTLCDSGEIQTGPAVYLLHWLLRHRARVRAAP